MIMTDKGHVVLATSLFNEMFHLAWGKTPVGYDVTNWSAGQTPPVEDANAVELLEEVGRRPTTYKAYVTEDVNGTIVANGLKWAESITPTRNVYLQFKFDASDASAEVIRQFALFHGTVVKPATPVGKSFLSLTDLDETGNLFMVENIQPISRNATTREIYEIVITF